MIPGEIYADGADHALNPGRRTLTLVVENTGDRPIQVGSHYHFAETNGALRFDRDQARGMRLNIASGTAVRFEPGSSARSSWSTTRARARLRLSRPGTGKPVWRTIQDAPTPRCSAPRSATACASADTELIIEVEHDHTLRPAAMARK